MREKSAGKDTTTGHWELAGVLLEEPFKTYEVFPSALVAAIEQEAGVQFIGNFPCSGTEVLQKLGAEHVKTGRPIWYTSADSVIQIAGHEESFGLQRLYEVCKVARRHADSHRIGRVIARPFVGEEGNWTRTSNRHDYSLMPPRTVLKALSEQNVPVVGVGKISDIFGGSGVTASHPTRDNQHGMETLSRLWQQGCPGFYFVNLVDFDMLYGHRRDVKGYGRCLEEFDLWLGGFLDQIQAEDLVIITADHGNDPTFPGTDHTREEVPLLVLFNHETGNLGVRDGFIDVAATLAQHFQVPWQTGTSFLTTPGA